MTKIKKHHFFRWYKKSNAAVFYTVLTEKRILPIHKEIAPYRWKVLLMAKYKFQVFFYHYLNTKYPEQGKDGIKRFMNQNSM